MRVRSGVNKFYLHLRRNEHTQKQTRNGVHSVTKTRQRGTSMVKKESKVQSTNGTLESKNYTQVVFNLKHLMGLKRTTNLPLLWERSKDVTSTSDFLIHVYNDVTSYLYHVECQKPYNLTHFLSTTVYTLILLLKSFFTQNPILREKLNPKHLLTAFSF